MAHKKERHNINIGGGISNLGGAGRAVATRGNQNVEHFVNRVKHAAITQTDVPPGDVIDSASALAVSNIKNQGAHSGLYRAAGKEWKQHKSKGNPSTGVGKSHDSPGNTSVKASAATIKSAVDKRKSSKKIGKR